MGIGGAGFEQLANVFCHGEMLFKTLLMSKNTDKYVLFLPKLSVYTLTLKTVYSHKEIMKSNQIYLPRRTSIWYYYCLHFLVLLGLLGSDIRK